METAACTRCFATLPMPRYCHASNAPTKATFNPRAGCNSLANVAGLLPSFPSRSHRPQRLVASPAQAMASLPQPSPSQTAAPGDTAGAVENILEAIRAHQATAARLSPVEEIRTTLNRSIRGMLSTFSKEHEGYPSGSMVDFACDHDGSPILAVSSLAVHTKNLLANPKCSLLVAKDPEDRTDLVVTVYGDAIPVTENGQEAARTAYVKKHPNAFWVDFGDFYFVRIEPKAVQYVSGIATALLGSGEFTAEEYKTAKIDPVSEFSTPITSHMNKDHSEDTKTIVQYSTSVQVNFAHMLDVDSFGFNVKAGYQGNTFKLRIPFPRKAEDRKSEGEEFKQLFFDGLIPKHIKKRSWSKCAQSRTTQAEIFEVLKASTTFFFLSLSLGTSFVNL